MIPHFVRAPARVHILLPISFLFDIKPLNNQRCYKVFTTELTENTENTENTEKLHLCALCELGGFSSILSKVLA